MVDVIDYRIKIPELPDIGPINRTEMIPVSRGGVTGRMTSSSVIDLAVGDATAATNALVTDISGGTLSSGAGNAYIVVSARNPAANVDGFYITWRADKTNTGASTLKVGAGAAAALKKGAGVALVAGDVEADGIYESVYIAATSEWRLREATGLAAAIAAALTPYALLNSPNFINTPTAPTQAAADNSTKLATTAYVDRNSYPAGYIYGMTWSRNVGVPATRIDISAGRAKSSDDASVIVFGATLTKRLDAAWAVGSTAGGMDTGAAAGSTLYAVWAILRTDTNVSDALFSLSFSAPTMPANYTKRRLIGAFLTDSSANIRAFQVFDGGDTLEYIDYPPLSVATSSLSTSPISFNVPVPPNAEAHVNLNILNTGQTAAVFLYCGDFTVTPTPSASSSPIATLVATIGTNGSIKTRVRASSGTAALAAVANGASTVLNVQVLGFSWRRTAI